MNVAQTLLNIVQGLEAGNPALQLGGIFHYSSLDKSTRYKIAVSIGEVLGLPTAHITPSTTPPAGAPRPKDAFLDSTKLSDAGLAAPCIPFVEGIRAVLDTFVVDAAAKTITPKSTQ